ncbi:ATP-binding protein [Clostridium sp. HBUAS56017]|uniref:ATP-binding protein n=1 Tax=Clostridium sp. HBUAS56017 TaxID=2571128 RepID=UPI001178B877|nr:ATP-binding protein [Clostridium sp. HBUAS56017]
MKNGELQRVNSYKCSKCRDSGWILVKEDGREVARSCECREKEKLNLQWKKAGINLEKSTQTFGNFKEWNQVIKKAKSISIAYANNFQKNQHSRQNSILLCGQVGSGKTHLAIALAINLINRNHKTVYMPYRDVVTKIKQNIINDSVYKKLIYKYARCEVLVIDDLYKGKISETDVNIMFEIINYRYLNYLPIIISSEFTIEKLLAFDEAIGSRIYEMCKDYLVEIPEDKNINYRLKA